MASTEFPGRATLHHLGGADGLPVLLLIHGFGSDRYSWAATAPAFFASHAVWAVELPGHTATPIEPGPGDAASMAEAVARAIEEGLSGPLSVVGHSLGGAVAVALAKALPGRIDALTLIAPAGFGAPPDAAFLEAFPRLSTNDEAQALLERLVSRPRLISPQMVQHVLGFLQRPGRRAALERIATALAALEIEALPEDIPVAAVWGDGDRINPLPERAAEAFGPFLHVLEGVGHMPHIEQARKTNTAIADTMARRKAG